MDCMCHVLETFQHHMYVRQEVSADVLPVAKGRAVHFSVMPVETGVL